MCIYIPCIFYADHGYFWWFDSKKANWELLNRPPFKVVWVWPKTKQWNHSVIALTTHNIYQTNCSFRFVSLYFGPIINVSCMSPKTHANLITYSRKPENSNGTIIFEIDIMKNSSPINLNQCQTRLFHKIFGCFFCSDLLCHTYALSM